MAAAAMLVSHFGGVCRGVTGYPKAIAMAEFVALPPYLPGVFALMVA